MMETSTAALARECREELCVDATSSQLLWLLLEKLEQRAFNLSAIRDVLAAIAAHTHFICRDRSVLVLRRNLVYVTVHVPSMIARNVMLSTI